MLVLTKKLKLTVHAPMVARIISGEGDGVGADPFPEDNLFCHRVCLHLTLHFNVEDL